MIPITVPSTQHLSRAYYELAQLGARAVGEKSRWPYRPKSVEELLAICGELSRHDPRLFELLLQTIRSSWQDINWLMLRKMIMQIQTPQVFGVIGEIIGRQNPELANCFRFLMHHIPKAPTQFFYQLLYTPGSPMAQRAIERGLKEFARWGFLASERPAVNADTKETAGKLSRSARLQCLKKLLTAHREVQIKDYLAALPHPISRQQALLDLKGVKGLRQKGSGRGAKWAFSTIRK